MNIISVKQLRENFKLVKETVNQGESLLLIYRSQPLAEIRPLKKREVELDKEGRREKNLQKVKKLAGGFRLGKGFSPQEMNKLYNRSYA